MADALCCIFCHRDARDMKHGLRRLDESGIWFCVEHVARSHREYQPEILDIVREAYQKRYEQEIRE